MKFNRTKTTIHDIPKEIVEESTKLNIFSNNSNPYRKNNNVKAAIWNTIKALIQGIPTQKASEFSKKTSLMELTAETQ